jgi:hypothetical protein
MAEIFSKGVGLLGQAFIYSSSENTALAFFRPAILNIWCSCRAKLFLSGIIYRIERHNCRRARSVIYMEY